MSCIEPSTPGAQAPIDQNRVTVVRFEGNQSVVSYPVRTDATLSNEIARLKSILNIVPADFVAVVPSPLLDDVTMTSFVRQGFQALIGSPRSKMVVYHSPIGPALVFQKSVWRTSQEGCQNGSIQNPRDMLKAFIEEVTLRREVPFVELSVPPKT